jgi:hypothetical protein
MTHMLLLLTHGMSPMEAQPNRSWFGAFPHSGSRARKKQSLFSCQLVDIMWNLNIRISELGENRTRGKKFLRLARKKMPAPLVGQSFGKSRGCYTHSWFFSETPRQSREVNLMLRAVGRVWTMSGPGNDSGHIQDCQNRHDTIATIVVVQSISLIVQLELTEEMRL